MQNDRINKVTQFLEEHDISYVMHTHPPLPTIEIALDYWKNIDSTHCKNLFFRNHKGNRHYLVVFECHKELFENGHRVKLFIDSDLQKSEKVSFHPCDNTASVVISKEDLIRFLGIWGGEYEWIEV